MTIKISAFNFTGTFSNIIGKEYLDGKGTEQTPSDGQEKHFERYFFVIKLC